MKRKKPADHPVSEVHWIEPGELHSNDYNPNTVFKTEMELLATSILETGWTMPIIARRDGTIVDGFHRWTIGSTNAKVMSLTGGLIPVVFMSDDTDDATQKLSTIRYNRARGQHGILKMGDIVRELREQGLTDKEIEERGGMEYEEISRLADQMETPDIQGKESFGKGWVPMNKPK